MGLRRLYQKPTESARHEQLKLLCEEYFTNMQKLMDRPSQLYAFRARKALTRLRKVAHQRGLELLSLYSPFQNQGKQPITKPQKQNHDRHKHRISTDTTSEQSQGQSAKATTTDTQQEK